MVPTKTLSNFERRFDSGLHYLVMIASAANCSEAAWALQDSPWFAIQVRSRSETRTHQELGLRGFESFLPVRQVRHRWSDRYKTIEEPLFPGYLFCRFDLSNRFRVLNTTGVAQIIGAGSTPIPVDESEIRSLRALVASETSLIPWPCLRTGQTASRPLT